MRDSPEQRQHWLCEQVLNCFESGWRLPRRSRPVVVAVPLTTAGVRRALVACFNEFERILRFASLTTMAREVIMAGKEIAVKKYVVRLSSEERQQLETLIRKGKGSARRLLKARIFLKADVSEAGEGWSDSRIIAALDTSASMVYRVR